MNFKLATMDDLESIMPIMLKGAERLVRSAYGVPHSEQSVRRVLVDCIERGLVLFGDTSVAGAIPSKFLYNENIVEAHIAFWFFTKPREIVILEKMVSVLRAAGIKRIHATSHFPENAILRRYSRLGFTPVEVVSTLTM